MREREDEKSIKNGDKWSNNGGFIPVYLHDIEVQMGAERFIAKVGFSEKLGVGFNLLGRAGIFDRFKICFQESQGILIFESEKHG